MLPQSGRLIMPVIPAFWVAQGGRLLEARSQGFHELWSCHCTSAQVTEQTLSLSLKKFASFCWKANPQCFLHFSNAQIPFNGEKCGSLGICQCPPVWGTQLWCANCQVPGLVEGWPKFTVVCEAGCCGSVHPRGVASESSTLTGCYHFAHSLTSDTGEKRLLSHTPSVLRASKPRSEWEALSSPWGIVASGLEVCGRCVSLFPASECRAFIMNSDCGD